MIQNPTTVRPAATRLHHTPTASVTTTLTTTVTYTVTYTQHRS